MTIAVQANILAIHDKLLRLLAKADATAAPVSTLMLLQGAGADSLRWSDATLDAFLQQQVKEKFGVVVQRRQIRSTLNGLEPTVGDLSIAISTAIQRQYRPRRSLTKEMCS